MKKNNIFSNLFFNYFHLLFITFAFIISRIFFFYIFDFESSFSSGDSVYYLEVAKSILNNNLHISHDPHPYLRGLGSEFGGNSYFRPPLYPFILSFLINYTDNYIFFYLIQSLIFYGFIIFLYSFFLKLKFKYIFFYCILISLNPSDIVYNGRILTETLITILILSSSILFFYSNKYRSHIISGLFLGLAALTKDFYVYLIFLFFIVGFFKKIKFKFMLINLIIFIIVVSPWYKRNYDLSNGEFFLSKGIIWSSLWAGTWVTKTNEFSMNDFQKSQFDQVFFNKYDFDISHQEVLEKIYEKEHNQDFFKLITLDYILKNPLEVIKTWIYRYPHLWIGSRTEFVHWKITYGTTLWFVFKIFFYFFNSIILILGFLGIILALLSKDKIIFLITPIFYHAVLYIPLYNVESRYSQPIFILLIFFSIYFYDYFMNKIRIKV